MSNDMLCEDCKFAFVEGPPCTECFDGDKWEAVSTPVTRNCDTCRHIDRVFSEEPCKSCDAGFNHWVPEVSNSSEVFTSEDMGHFFIELQQTEYHLWEKKNKDYADHEGEGKGNTFANFELIAEELGLKTEEVVWVYLRKQLQALLRYVKYGKLETEPLMNRIIDARNFLAILGGVARKKGDL